MERATETELEKRVRECAPTKGTGKVVIKNGKPLCPILDQESFEYVRCANAYLQDGEIYCGHGNYK